MMERQDGASSDRDGSKAWTDAHTDPCTLITWIKEGDVDRLYDIQRILYIKPGFTTTPIHTTKRGPWTVLQRLLENITHFITTPAVTEAVLAVPKP